MPKTNNPIPEGKSNSGIYTGLLAVLLALVAAAPYYGVWDFGFVSFDDPNYVSENPLVLAGLDPESIYWAFTSGHASNWHPVTWLSLMLDVSLFGPEAGAMHSVNLLIHIINTLLLYGFLNSATRMPARSAVVAALFAVHPLHVESVAWISERKDVLSTLFMFSTCWAYLAYTRHKSIAKYLVILLLLALGLMTKPMLVTLPFVLLLMDFWPLRRVDLVTPDHTSPGKLVVEKLPMFAMVAASSVMTLVLQTQGGAVAGTDAVPLTLRLANSAISYWEYVARCFAPQGLAVLYPFPDTIPAWKVAGATAFLALTTVAVIKALPRFPYLLVGWFWYLGTLIPVIGLVQVGAQAMADRYSYIPLVGIFIMLVWGISDLLGKNRSNVLALKVTAVLVISALSAASFVQSRYWANSNSLWKRALDVTSGNYRAHVAYGSLLLEQGAPDLAADHFERAIEIRPGYAEAHNKLGALLSDQENWAEAAKHYRAALAEKPEFPEANNNLGNALAALGQPQDALAFYEAAIEAKPDYPDAFNGLGSALDDLGRIDEAIQKLREAIALDPEFAPAYVNLASVYYKTRQFEKALDASGHAVSIKPGEASYQTNHAICLMALNRNDEARSHLQKALALNPDDRRARDILDSLSKAGRNNP